MACDLLTGVKVLLADTHATGRKIVKKILMAYGCEVEEATDTLTLQHQWNGSMEGGQRFDLLLLDYTLLQTNLTFFDTPSQQNLEPNKILLLLPSQVSCESMHSIVWLQNARSLRKPVFKYRLLKVIRQMVGMDPDDEKSTVDLSIRKKHVIPFQILLVEDNLDNQKLATTILEQAGHLITVANNGLEALTLLQEKSFHLVLMDLQMPEMDGIMTTKQIRASNAAVISNPQIPIIAVTAKAIGEEKQECLNAGMNGYLKKPYRSQELLNIIEKIMQPHQQPQHQSMEKQPRPVLKPVDLDPNSFMEKGSEFIQHFPIFLQDLAYAINTENSDHASRLVAQLSERSRVIGAMNVSVQGIRVRGHTDQKNWEDARSALVTLESLCQETKQAILVKNSQGNATAGTFFVVK